MDYGARFYDPALGRFVSADSIVPEPGNPQALNRYAYVLGNPLRYVDPSGHCSIPITLFGLNLGVFSIGSVSCPWDKKKDAPIFDNPLKLDETLPIMDNPPVSGGLDLPVFDGAPSGVDDLDLPTFDFPLVPSPSTGSDIVPDLGASGRPGRLEAKNNPQDRQLDKLCKMYGCTPEERREIRERIHYEKGGSGQGTDGKDVPKEEIFRIIEEVIGERENSPATDSSSE